MNDQNELLSCEAEVKDIIEIPVDDERYPGSFFRIPAPPIAGKTGWSLS